MGSLLVSMKTDVEDRDKGDQIPVTCRENPDCRFAVVGNKQSPKRGKLNVADATLKISTSMRVQRHFSVFLGPFSRVNRFDRYR